MECKKGIFGKRICKFGSGMIVTLPMTTTTPVPVNIVTSKSCKMCNTMADQFMKRLKPINNLLQPKIIDMDSHPEQVPSDVLQLPSITVGKHRIDSHTNDRELMQTIQHYLGITDQ